MFYIKIVFTVTRTTVIYCVFYAAVGFVLYDAIQIIKRTENKDE